MRWSLNEARGIFCFEERRLDGNAEGNELIVAKIGTQLRENSHSI